MKRCPNPRLLAVLAALCISLLAVGAFAQFQTGSIYGKVQAKDGSALPGVTVTITGMGAPQNSVSDAQGNFRFLSLSPGAYTLKAELAGYGMSTRAGISVNVGRNSDVTMTLSPSVAESITVTAEAPLLDVRKSGTSTNVTKVEMENIPTSRDPWTVLQSVPSVQVDRINVGGNQSGQQSVYIGKGSTADQNTWNVDGVNITDMGATGSSPLYFDFDSFEEMQVTTGGSDPRIMTPGVQLNMVTKRGTNDFRGSGRDFYTPGSYQASTAVPAEAATYLSQTNAINYVRDYGVEAGGPVWKDHLWAWVAISENKISDQLALASTASAVLFDNIILRDKNAKLNGQITASNSATGFYTFGDKVRNARNLSPTRPFETAWHQSGPTKVYKAEDTQIFGSSLYLTGMWSKISGGFGLIPNGGIGVSAPTPFRDLSLVWHNSFQEYITDRPQKQYRVDGSKFFDMGSMNHELKFGFGYRDTPVSSSSSWPGADNGYVRQRAPSYCTAAGQAATVQCMQVLLSRDKNLAYAEKYTDLYVGDTILMGNLTLQAGLRYDGQKSRNTASAAPANPVIGTPITIACGPIAISQAVCNSAGFITTSLPAISYGGDSRDLKWTSLSPRIGLTYALGADKKTLLRAGYNRYVSQIGATVSLANPIGYTYDYFTADDKNGDHIITRNELLRFRTFAYFDPTNPASTQSATRVDYNMKPTHSDEIILGIDRELMSDFSVGANLTYRKINDIVAARAEKTQGSNNWYTRADYVLVGHTDTNFANPTPGTGPVNTQTLPSVAIYDLKPGIAPPTFFVLTNRPDYSQSYKGIELNATKRLSHKWMMRGSVSFTDWTENCGAATNPDPTPFLGNCPGGQFTQRSAGSGSFGNVFINSKWQTNITGLYQLPWDFNIGASLTARQGYPRPFRETASLACPSATDCLANDGINTDKEVIIQPIGTTRFPNIYELDLRAAKDFRFMNRIGLTLSADLFNVPNKRTVLQRNTLLDLAANGGPGTGDRITELQSPRVWRFGAKLNF
jgi:hypothetical protein